MTVVLESRDLTKTIGGVRAVVGMSVSIDAGEVIGLIGPNGAGKTTFVNLVTGITRPDHGQVVFLGRDVTSWPPNKRARSGLARSFQGTVLYHEQTVEENLVRALLPKRGYSAWDAAARPFHDRREQTALRIAVRSVLEEVNLVPLKGRVSRTLPYGYQKLLGVLMCMVGEPRLVLLDEPCAGLTDAEIKHVLSLIRAAKQRNIAVLVIEHNIDVVLKSCSRIVVMHHGEKIAEGTAAEVTADQAVIEAYLGYQQRSRAGS